MTAYCNHYDRYDVVNNDSVISKIDDCLLLPFGLSHSFRFTRGTQKENITAHSAKDIIPNLRTIT